MESEQIGKRVSWLDEQRRKDSEHIARIHERLDGFEDALRQQSTRLEQLTTELAQLSSVTARVRQFDDSLNKHREQVNKQIETLDERRMSRESQLESIRKSDQKQVSDSLSELRSMLSGIEEIRDAVEQRRQEEIRLNRALDELSNQVKQLSRDYEQRGHRLVSLQESRNQDAKRIAEIDGRNTELTKKIEALRGPLELVEDQLTKLKTKSSELEQSHSELRHAQTVWSEQQSVRLAEFERQWKAWEQQFEAYVTQAQETDKKMEGYQETFRELVRLRDELKSVTDAIERRISEVGEIQRLNAERFREQWAGFQADDQKRWTSFTLGSDELWKDHNRTHHKLDGELEAIQADLQDTSAALAELSRSSQQRLEELIALVRDWEADLEHRTEAD